MHLKEHETPEKKKRPGDVKKKGNCVQKGYIFKLQRFKKNAKRGKE